MLKINDSVKVKPGIKDPDNEMFDIGGWQGRITEIESSKGEDAIVTIAWDSITLLAMTREFIEESVRDGYAFAEMNLIGASCGEGSCARERPGNQILRI